ncbi:MAG: 2-phosphosulfolactate phosphatase [Candidatus ainarchaeum sp.]|nr:2-phosphosulfolactate phosphatase [Candidatus ainarchaeum sp.]MDD3975725.1 2-phosphosulfolactate phosphatase [Candidatus ainarchaeum sp.]
MNIKLIYGLDNIPSRKLDLVVVIDVFRSSSVICNCIKNNAAKINLFSSKLDILQIPKEKNFLFCGEENCSKINFFDKGNSPLEYLSDLSGKYVYYISGFGSKALLKSNSDNIFLIGLINLKYASYIFNKYFSDRNIYLIIGGNKDVICMDDFICAGVFISSLNFKKLDELSLNALNLVIQYKSILVDLLYESPAAKYLISCGFKKDVEYCILKELNLLPFKINNEIVKFNEFKFS